ncbi:hypothetical protein [Gloeobacter kilaueensis]|uniref:Uncharacterized protein n=1 Tax=Gloeobacter kilaueensis (strain ATCC BAA-2537 / CCAP 1431/1 / ULC 316 / JS1) TaxID=1183438 RepID=U5QDP8_GLOK1|nr:hypothetical protein [Gloeobacter kilaueensis]AGY57031.1 hypothetical protein GKIL_0785 [Gloeobacter kilaueensis JS1]
MSNEYREDAATTRHRAEIERIKEENRLRIVNAWHEPFFNRAQPPQPVKTDPPPKVQRHDSEDADYYTDEDEYREDEDSHRRQAEIEELREANRQRMCNAWRQPLSSRQPPTVTRMDSRDADCPPALRHLLNVPGHRWDVATGRLVFDG